jgi:hypothetical protein
MSFFSMSSVALSMEEDAGSSISAKDCDFTDVFLADELFAKPVLKSSRQHSIPGGCVKTKN